jgi:NitT/TauT family transport system ATP-binding protein
MTGDRFTDEGQTMADGRSMDGNSPASAAGQDTVPAVQLSSVGKIFETGQGRLGAKGTTAVTALTDIDVTVAPGEFVSLIGPSGCGKSTLMRLVADLDQPTSGTIRVFGKTPHQARLDQDYGIAFQAAGLLPWRTVRANIELPLEVHGVGRDERRARADELLTMVRLTDFAGHRPDQLSGGMQQRVAIARALAERPRLLLMDEPFGALDEMTRERMQGELVQLTAQAGSAVIFVTHSIPEAVYLSDRVLVMSPRPGRISAVVPIVLPDRSAAESSSAQRSEDTREDPRFFAAVTAVREALRAHPDNEPQPVNRR